MQFVLSMLRDPLLGKSETCFSSLNESLVKKPSQKTKLDKYMWLQQFILPTRSLKSFTNKQWRKTKLVSYFVTRTKTILWGGHKNFWIDSKLLSMISMLWKSPFYQLMNGQFSMGKVEICFCEASQTTLWWMKNSNRKYFSPQTVLFWPSFATLEQKNNNLEIGSMPVWLLFQNLFQLTLMRMK